MAKKKTSKKMGRPPVITDKLKEVILNLAVLGDMTDKKICEIVGISVPTLITCKKNDPEFFNQLKIAKEQADSEILNAMRDLALGKAITRETHEGVDANGNIVDKKVIKEHAPNYSAGALLLKIRHKEKFADNTNVTHEAGESLREFKTAYDHNQVKEN